MHHAVISLFQIRMGHRNDLKTAVGTVITYGEPTATHLSMDRRKPAEDQILKLVSNKLQMLPIDLNAGE
jgi:hypothetical protein